VTSAKDYPAQISAKINFKKYLLNIRRQIDALECYIDNSEDVDMVSRLLKVSSNLKRLKGYIEGGIVMMDLIHKTDNEKVTKMTKKVKKTKEKVVEKFLSKREEFLRESLRDDTLSAFARSKLQRELDYIRKKKKKK
jgi:predicted component of type VI protein secretion system